MDPMLSQFLAPRTVLPKTIVDKNSQTLIKRANEP